MDAGHGHPAFGTGCGAGGPAYRAAGRMIEQLAYLKGGGIAVSAWDGAGERTIVPPPTGGSTANRAPVWWNATTVAFLRFDNAAGTTQIVLVPTSGTGPEQPVFATPLSGLWGSAVAVNPKTGDLVFGHRGGYWIARYQHGSGFAAPAFLLGAESGSSLWAAVAPEGNKIAYRRQIAGAYQLFVANMDGGEARQVTAGCAEVGHAAWSPRSDRIAVATGSDGGSVDVRDLMGSVSTYVAGAQPHVTGLVWRPQSNPAPSPVPSPGAYLSGIAAEPPRAVGTGACAVLVAKSATDGSLWVREQPPGFPAAAQWRRFSEPVLDYAVSFGWDGTVAVAARRASDQSLWFLSAPGRALPAVGWTRLGDAAADVHLTSRSWTEGAGYRHGLMVVARDAQTNEVYANELMDGSASWLGWYRLGGPASEIAVPVNRNDGAQALNTPVVARTPSWDGVYLREVGPQSPADWTRVGDAAAKVRVDQVRLQRDGVRPVAVITAQSPYDKGVYGVSWPSGQWQKLGDGALDWTTQAETAPPAAYEGVLHVYARNPMTREVYKTVLTDAALPSPAWSRAAPASRALPALQIAYTYPQRAYNLCTLGAYDSGLYLQSCVQGQCSAMPVGP